MIWAINTTAQSSFGLTGAWGLASSSSVMLNSLESNPSGLTSLKDWGLSLSYGSEFSEGISSNLYLISLFKNTGDHFLTGRYSPGFQKEFIFNSSESIFLQDSTTQSLSSRFSYSELFGLGYSYKISNTVNAGISLRYFTQEFTQEEVSPVFLSDTLYLTRTSSISDFNFWKGDFGFSYAPAKEILFSISSINLLNFSESAENLEAAAYKLRTDKAALFGIMYEPLPGIDFNFLYETNNSFQFSSGGNFKFLYGNFGLGVTIFHHKDQDPFIAGFIPAISYSGRIFGAALSGVKYFSERNKLHSFSDFAENGIDNIINNRYSFDKAVLTFSFKLNTISEQKIKFIGVEIIEEIYPAFLDKYLDNPFAVGKVVNISDQPVTIKPFSKIAGLNDDEIQSPQITLASQDTAEIKFYTILSENYSKNKPEISYAEFFIKSSSDDFEDQVQTPLLINGINSWNGKVIDLKYFIKKDLDFSLSFTRNILSGHKETLDTLPGLLTKFYKSKIIFNELVKDIIYTADPRASAEYVQYPKETISLKGGDCDDLSVCYSSLLEAAGIETALVDYKSGEIRHVNVMVNTELSPGHAKKITQNDNKYFIRKNSSGNDQVWIVVETTSLTDFDEAWNTGTQKFNEDAFKKLGLSSGMVEIIDVY
jgi:hypothetical protein